MTLSSTRQLFHARLDDDGHVVSLPADLSAKSRLAVPASNRRFCRRRRRTCSPDDLDRPAAVEGMDSGIGGRPVRVRVGRSVRPAEGDHRRDSETAGRRDQHGRGGGRGRAGATARSTIAASAVSTVKPAEEICPSSGSYIKS
jgi:hypothetical protein